MQPAIDVTTSTLAARDTSLPVVDVWQARLDRHEEEVVSFLEVLSPDEVERAGRFVFRRDRNRYVVARGTLRTILAQYVPLTPGDLDLAYSPLGKPELATQISEGSLHFNVSHAGGIALYAVSTGQRVGIDVEEVVADRAEEGVARLVFSMHENDVLQSLQEPERKEAFFTYWTLKEAYAKALGMGLQLPLTGLTISDAPEDPALRGVYDRDGQPIEPWRLIPLPILAPYKAALAVEARAFHIRYRRINDDVMS